MDAARFDRWTSSLVEGWSSRRGFVRLGLGGGLAVVRYAQVTDEALACRRNGKSCGSGRNGGCCSGTCKRGKCRPTRGAAGCMVNGGDFCKNQVIGCPKNPGGACVKLDNGKPFCAEGSDCQPCTTNASCTFRPNGKCLKTCPYCSGADGQACVYPRV